MEAVREFTVTHAGIEYPTRIEYDVEPTSPRDDYDASLATLVQVDNGWLDPDPMHDIGYAVKRAWDQWRDFDMTARYLRLFYGAVAVAEWTGNGRGEGGHVFAVVTPADMAKGWGDVPWTAEDAAKVVTGELAEYVQYVEGEVYGVVVEDPFDGREAALWGIFTEDGSSDDPYLTEVAKDQAAELAADVPYSSSQIRRVLDLDEDAETDYAVQIQNRTAGTETKWLNLSAAQVRQVMEVMARKENE